MGGVVYYAMSLMLYHTDSMGKAMGVAASVALLLLSSEFIPVLADNDMPVLYGQTKNPQDSTSDAVEERNKKAKKGADRLVWRIVLIEVLMEVFFFYYNQSIITSMAESGIKEQNAYDWPRLCGIVSYLAIGFVGDMKKRKFVPIASLCLIIPGLITPLIPINGSGHMITMAIFYVAVMARISYFSLMFWDAAPRTKNPELWAGMGRIVTSLAGVSFAIVGLSALSVVQMIAVEI